MKRLVRIPFHPIAALAAVALVCFAEPAAVSASELSEADRLEITLEALKRIEGNLETRPELKAPVHRVLDRLQGQPAFVDVVRRFQVRDRDAELLEIAARFAAEESGVEAMRLVLAHNNLGAVAAALDGSDALKVVEVLGHCQDKRAVPLLLPLLADRGRDAVLRKAAVRSLARTQEGAGQLLELAKAGELSPDLQFTAGTELNNVRWAKIKSEAQKTLPLPQTRNAEPLPSPSELVRMKGNASAGESVFFRPETACGNCHKVRGRGIEIGPDLSEIGTKLGREALLEAILDPNAGISFGFETYQVELKSGDELFGLIVSETEDELAVKDLQGIVSRVRKSDVARREQMKTSIMPGGLSGTMSTQELADLLEYLSSLTAPAN